MFSTLYQDALQLRIQSQLDCFGDSKLEYIVNFLATVHFNSLTHLVRWRVSGN